MAYHPSISHLDSTFTCRLLSNSAQDCLLLGHNDKSCFENWDQALKRLWDQAPSPPTLKFSPINMIWLLFHVFFFFFLAFTRASQVSFTVSECTEGTTFCIENEITRQEINVCFNQLSLLCLCNVITNHT